MLLHGLRIKAGMYSMDMYVETNCLDICRKWAENISCGLPAAPFSSGRIDEVETALLGLESIDACEVSRTAAGSAEQHVWAVTFLEASCHVRGLAINGGVTAPTYQLQSKVAGAGKEEFAVGGIALGRMGFHLI